MKYYETDCRKSLHEYNEKIHLRSNFLSSNIEGFIHIIERYGQNKRIILRANQML